MRTQFSGMARPYADKRASANRLLEYFQQNNPDFYQYVMKKLQSNGLSAVGDENGETDIFDKIIGAAQTFYTIKQQRDIIEMQTKRAEQGLPPLDVSQISTPAIKVQVDAPEAREMVTQAGTELGEKIKPFLVPIGIGVALWLFTRFNK